MATKKRKNQRKSTRERVTRTVKPIEKLSIKSWPPEVNVENPSSVGALIVIMVVLITGFFIWLQNS